MLNVAVIGFGTVGSGVCELLTNNADIIEKNAGEKINLKYICDIREFPDSPFADKLVKDFEIIANDPEVDIVVETMGGRNAAYKFTTMALENGKSVVESQMETSLIYPQSGWVEQNPLEIWETVYEVVKEVVLSPKIDYHDIVALGITNQRETTILWDKTTGEPVYNAIIWQSRQSQYICDDLVENGYDELIKSKTGLIINPYFSADALCPAR